MTEWRAVPGYPGYEVSDDGRVRSLDRDVEYRLRDGRTIIRRHRGMELSRASSERGYLTVRLYRDKKGQTRSVHSIVLTAFKGPCPPGHEGLHADDDPSNCAAENLDWGTHRQNIQDCVDRGRHPLASKERCPRDHALVAPNLVAGEVARGWRGCLACQRARARANHHGHDDAWFRAEADRVYAEIMGGAR